MDPTGAVVERDLAGSTCMDVSAALALIAAVSLDALPAHWQRALPAPPRQKKRPNRLAIGATMGIHNAVAPREVPMIGLSATFHDRQVRGSPEVRFEALISLDKYQPVTDAATLATVGRARFLWVSSRSTACPLQVNLASTTLGPCAFVELGRLKGSGATSQGDRSKTGWWFAPGALLNWSLQADPVWVRLAGGAVIPVIRHTFRFEPDPLIFQTPSLGVIAQFELAWAF